MLVELLLVLAQNLKVVLLHHRSLYSGHHPVDAKDNYNLFDSSLDLLDLEKLFDYSDNILCDHAIAN